MVHGLAQIKEMNDNAVKVYEAKKAGLIPEDYPEGRPLVIVEKDADGKRTMEVT